MRSASEEAVEKNLQIQQLEQLKPGKPEVISGLDCRDKFESGGGAIIAEKLRVSLKKILGKYQMIKAAILP